MKEGNKSDFTVESMLGIYNNSISTSFDQQLINLEGFYQANSKDYNGSFYDTLYDENKQDKLTILLNGNQRNKLTPGSYYKLQGYLNRYSRSRRDGSFQLVYKVTRILDQLDEHQFISKEEFDLVRGRFDKAVVDIQNRLLMILRKNRNPSISIITGASSIVDKDCMSQLNGVSCFDLSFHRTSMSNATNVLKAIKQQERESPDLIVCMRGGGEGLEVFNDLKLSKEILALQIPFATAIGHKADLTSLERIADMGFATPTAFGSFLNKVAHIYESEVEESIKNRSEIQNLKKEIDGLKLSQDKVYQSHERDKQNMVIGFKERLVSLETLNKKLVYAILALGFLLILSLYLLFT